MTSTGTGGTATPRSISFPRPTAMAAPSEVFPPPVTTDPPPPRLRELALAAVALAAHVDPPSASNGNTGLERRFLAAQRAAAQRGHAPWAETVLATILQPAAEDTSLVALGRELSLTVFEWLAIALASAVEDDALVGRALAHVQHPLGGSRPTAGLLVAALAECLTPGLSAQGLLLGGSAVRNGLLVLPNETLPLPERPVLVPLPLCLALSGHDADWPGTTLGLGSTPVIPLPPSILRHAAQHARALASRPDAGVVIRSGTSAEGRNVAAEIARVLHRRLLLIETDRLAGLGPLLRLRHLLPAFVIDLAPGERRVLPAIPGYHGPVVALAGPDGTVESPQGPIPSWTIPVVPREERTGLWAAALGATDGTAELARHHRHGIGRIAALGTLACQIATLDNRSQPAPDDVADAAATGDGTGLESLAEPIRTPVSDEALVLTDTLRSDLESLLLRCRVRDELASDLGASASTRYRPGVRALFVGPSGTGKTLAASWLATRLRMPLYRVDLANVTSKYIGETEKNLAQLLARAEQAEVILLFDEADSLFGKRTEVRDSNDRFANAQTNYLLQRIESYDGITLLTSNNKSRFDSSFARRLDLVIHFDLPAPRERRALWLSHLGTHHTLSDLQLNRLAALVDLGGGHIRNIVLTSAVAARAAQRRIELPDLLDALDAEYRKLSRPLPQGLRE